MSRSIKRIAVVALLMLPAIFLGMPLLSRVLGPPSMGTGSYKYARLWRDKLAACDSLDDVRKRFKCARWEATGHGSHVFTKDPNTLKNGNTWALLYEFPDGDWLAMAYRSSHNTWGGGTAVTRDSAGHIRVYFGHVCGYPFAVGESLEEVYADIISPLSRLEEVSLGQ